MKLLQLNVYVIFLEYLKKYEIEIHVIGWILFIFAVFVSFS